MDSENTVGPMAEMPRYKCHKEVWALKIARAEQIVRASDGAVTGYRLHFEDAGYAPVEVSSEWARRTDSALAGGYYVVYEDGYKSYSPAAAFESGYTSVETKTATEAEIAAVSTAPRVTPADIAANIVSEHYFTATHGVDGAVLQQLRSANPSARPTILSEQEDPPVPANSSMAALSLLTFCVLVLRNGFTVTGQSACASPENFNADIGRKIARENAVEQVWTLLGYELKERLYQRTVPANPPVEA